MSLLVTRRLLNVLLFKVFGVLLEACNLALEIFTSLPQLIYVRRHLVLLLLSHKGLPHAVRYGRLVEALVCGNRHLDFIANSHEEEATLSTVDRDLTNELIEALRV